ncbi:hypothetical protein ACFWY9_08380 [Amycolatopsis sp. NPDC059027]|uniref:hypothetical protein n=1 Tax=Amycolatopsis sp. NPDC059027 TaxID=3346709 RepID=UPI003671C821
MYEETKLLIESLKAVSRHAGPIADALMMGTMKSDKQREYGDMLKELSGLLCEHADLQDERAESSKVFPEKMPRAQPD